LPLLWTGLHSCRKLLNTGRSEPSREARPGEAGLKLIWAAECPPNANKFRQTSKDCFPMPCLWCNNDPLREQRPNCSCLMGWVMWIEKLERLLDGVVELDTPIGTRYVQPTLAQRAFLIWTFRNFFSLPQQVLRPRERRLIDRLWSENRFVSLARAGTSDRPIIGRVERRVQASAEILPITHGAGRKPVAGSTSAGERNREAASA
jgi:hypothetical protein